MHVQHDSIKELNELRVPMVPGQRSCIQFIAGSRENLLRRRGLYQPKGILKVKFFGSMVLQGPGNQRSRRLLRTIITTPNSLEHPFFVQETMPIVSMSI